VALRPARLLPPKRLSTPRSARRLSTTDRGLLPGSPAITRTGLPPAGLVQFPGRNMGRALRTDRRRVKVRWIHGFTLPGRPVRFSVQPHTRPISSTRPGILLATRGQGPNGFSGPDGAKKIQDGLPNGLPWPPGPRSSPAESAYNLDFLCLCALGGIRTPNLLIRSRVTGVSSRVGRSSHVR